MQCDVSDERLICSLRAAIDRTYEAWDYYRSRATIARHLGNGPRERACAAVAARYTAALGRLEAFADWLGLFLPCCRDAAEGKFCHCA